VKRVGILGLPQSGKTTLFEILMQGAGVPAAPGRESIGTVRVPDERVDRLSAMYRPRKTTYAQIQFVDTVATARAGARGPDLFASVRNCDALLAVVREFGSADVDPPRDLANLETELIVNDLAILESRIEKIDKELRVGRREAEAERDLLARCRVRLEAGEALRGEVFSAEELKRLRGFQLLTLKPLLIVYNQDDGSRRETSAPDDSALRKVGPRVGAVSLRAGVEREIVALAGPERQAFRAELGVVEDGLSLVIRACYELLDLVSFFTVGPDEVRAWTVPAGGRAVDAAAEIHTDLARGFIRAEVIAWERLLEAGGEPQARERGWMRLEGRDYVVQDGDCIEVRFSR
jgi:GTP-binding protein YchF